MSIAPTRERLHFGVMRILVSTINCNYYFIIASAMDTIGSKRFVANLSDDFLLDELKASFQRRGFNAYDKDNHARTLLGVLLYRHRGNSCDYAKVVRQVKDEIGENGFKVISCYHRTRFCLVMCMLKLMAFPRVNLEINAIKISVEPDQRRWQSYSDICH